MTTALNIKYRKPVATGDAHKVEVRATTREVKRNFVFMDVTLKCDGELCSTAELTFYCFPKEKAVEEFMFLPFEVKE